MPNIVVFWEMLEKEYWYKFTFFTMVHIDIDFPFFPTINLSFYLSMCCKLLGENSSFPVCVYNIVLWLHLIWQVSMGNGMITSHALTSLEARGILFVTPGMEVSRKFQCSSFLLISFDVLFLCYFLFFLPLTFDIIHVPVVLINANITEILTPNWFP